MQAREIESGRSTLRARVRLNAKETNHEIRTSLAPGRPDPAPDHRVPPFQPLLRLRAGTAARISHTARARRPGRGRRAAQRQDLVGAPRGRASSAHGPSSLVRAHSRSGGWRHRSVPRSTGRPRRPAVRGRSERRAGVAPGKCGFAARSRDCPRSRVAGRGVR
jgi:hypothetical protein